MPNIKVKGPDGEVLTFEGVERVLMDDADGGPAVPFSYGDAVENIPIALDLAEGDQQVVAEDGMLVKSATIIKPTTLTPDNIRSGVEVAGVVGEYNGEGEPVTVALDMAEGDQVVTPPTEGKWLASVTVKKPEGLTPDNIRLGVEVGGVTGTLIGDTEEATVELDMAEGDQVVEPSAHGKVLSRVTVKKPETLIPENIAEGVEIAGVEGAHKGGGMDAVFVAFYGSGYAGEISATKTNITHSLTVPAAAVLISVRGNCYSETQFSYAYLTTLKFLEMLDKMGAHTRSGDTVSITYSFSTNRSTDHYLIFSEVKYTCPGVTMEKDSSGSLVLKADSSAPFCPEARASMVEVNKIDFSRATFTEIPANFCKRGVAVSSVLLPPTITSIGGSAFYGCTALTSAVIPDGVTSIGASAFYGCTGITSVTIPDGVTSIGGSLFYNCTGLTSVTLPASVASYGTQVFRNCSSLVSVALPSGVTSIGSYDFYGCKGLTSVGIPDGVTSIGTYAFYNCTSLASVVIPDGVASIGTYAFYNCTSLVEVDMSRCTSVPTLANNNFNSKPTGLQIKVPASLYDSFIAATNWSALASYIVAV